MYEIRYAQTAAKAITKLPKEIQKRILASLERARIRPEKYFERLVGEQAYKLRIGDYRVIADIHDRELLILVIKVGHRRNIYK